MKNNKLLPLIIASLSIIFLTVVSADDQNVNNKKGANKQSAGQPHAGKVTQQAAPPHASAPQRQQVQQQAAPRAPAQQRHQVAQQAPQQAAPRVVSQQVNPAPRGNGQYSKHGNPATIQQAQVNHGANQNVRPQSVVTQNPQQGVSVRQNRGNHVSPAQVVASQQGVNNGSVRSPRQLSGGVVSPQSQYNNGGGGGQQPQMTPNGQYNSGNNYGGYWSSGNTHSDWNHSGQHYWNNNNYVWYQGGWLIVNSLFNPYYVSSGYANNGYSNNGYNGSSMASSVQSRLVDLGYYNGPVDGDIGPGSRNAIANFQRDNNLYVNGRITNQLLQSLQLL